MTSDKNEKIYLGVSSCLLGEKVRFDGGHKQDTFILKKLAPFAEFKSFCPEVSIGLGIPREPIRLVMNTQSGVHAEQIRVVGTKNESLDVTEKLQHCAESQQSWLQNLDGYIFKKDSPSCGVERVKLYKDGHPTRQGGVGQFSYVVMQNNPLLPVEEEGRLNDARLKENFVQRVYIYKCWKMMVKKGLKAKDLIAFHSRIKYVLMSRSQKDYRELGRLISDLKKEELETLSEKYIRSVMGVLKKVSSRKNHVNVLQHIQGYLKQDIESNDKQELAKLIHDYRESKIPLIVPLTLLRHYFRKHPDGYIEQSWYLKLYPDELGLQNTI